MIRKMRLESGHSFIWNSEENTMEILYETDGYSESMEFPVSDEALEDIKGFFSSIQFTKEIHARK